MAGRRLIGQYEEEPNEPGVEDKKRLEKDMEMVLTTLQRYHTGTVLSWTSGHINPEHPCRFRRNPLGPRGDPDTELFFTCQVRNDKLVAIVPLLSPGRSFAGFTNMSGEIFQCIGVR